MLRPIPRLIGHHVRKLLIACMNERDGGETSGAVGLRWLARLGNLCRFCLLLLLRSLGCFASSRAFSSGERVALMNAPKRMNASTLTNATARPRNRVVIPKRLNGTRMLIAPTANVAMINNPTIANIAQA